MIFFSVHIILSIDKADIYRTFKRETIGTHTHKKKKKEKKKDAVIARASILAS